MVTGVVHPPPPDKSIDFYRAYISAFPLLVDFHRIYMLLTHALALPANRSSSKKKSVRACALGDN